MHTIIYFNDKPLHLTSEITKDLEELLHHEETVLIDEFNSHTVKAMIHEMQSPRINAGVFLDKDVPAVLKVFKKKFSFFIAAGGLVHTNGNEILLIYRRGKWDLPKGKLDDHEALEDCAVREIKEETGLQKIKIEKSLCITYHTYHQGEKYILKESHWFLVSSAPQKEFVPQTEEDIEKCEWVATDKLATYLENTHASVRDVVKAGLSELK